jgi:hypothetical protein|nr:MAG TPA: hypothetical protein [Bacteriophage sp.]
MSALGLKTGTIVIPFNSTPIQIEGRVYKNLSVLARLMSMTELDRAMRINLEDPATEDELYEEIFKTCVISVPGIPEGVDYNNSAAGFVSTVGKVIFIKSKEYVEDPFKAYDRAVESVPMVEAMAAVISRFLGIKYYEAKALPINDLFEMYAACHVAFPNEVAPIVKPEEDKSGPPS